jgi:hypothetical protein
LFASYVLLTICVAFSLELREAFLLALRGHFRWRCVTDAMGGFLMVEYHKSSAAHVIHPA